MVNRTPHGGTRTPVRPPEGAAQTLRKTGGAAKSNPALCGSMVRPKGLNRVAAAAARRIVIVGGGVAGLTAAAHLARAGYEVILLEARSRLGGRIHSAQPAGWPVPVEMGAEFIHGGNTASKALLRRGNIRTRQLNPNVWWRDAATGVLGLVPDYWERIRAVVGRIAPRDKPRSFADFLARHEQEISPADRILAAHYVGGFEAAPVMKISARSLGADHAGTDAIDQKITGRYDAVVGELERECRAVGVVLHLNSPVAAIRWSAGRVSVNIQRKKTGTKRSFEARAAVITLPLGVWKAQTVLFSPALEEKRALVARLGWGQVTRVVFKMRRGFWTAPFMPRALGSKQGSQFGFVNAPGQPIPVWWALHAPAPILTGWAGGEPAVALSTARSPDVRRLALQSLTAILGTTPPRIEPWISGFAHVNWGREEYTRGAYSFPVAGLEDGARQLAQPVADTLFFAGEATASEYGTVHGAIESGARAAREIKATLRRR